MASLKNKNTNTNTNTNTITNTKTRISKITKITKRNSIIKHLHMTIALISVSLFTLRFIWLLIGSDKLQQKWLKVLPHMIDTLLLGLGVAMAIKLTINPFEQYWFAEKLLAVVAYIITGYYTLKLAQNKIMQIIGYLGALGWVMLIVRLVMTKTPLFLG
jgi:uncharacterized membrane protein SirB2